MSQELYLDEVERLQAELDAEDPSTAQQEARDAQVRADAASRFADEREAAVAAATAALSARVRRLQEAVRVKASEEDAKHRHTERRLEEVTSQVIEQCHQQRRAVMRSIATMRDTIAVTAEELRVGYHLKRPDHQVFFPKRSVAFERVTARAEAQPKDDEVVELEAANADLERELSTLQEAHAELHLAHQKAAAEATLQAKDNKAKVAALRSHIHRTRNTARSQRRQCEDLRRDNASIMAGCAVLYSQVNNAYYGIHGGPKSIRMMEQRQRRVSERKLLQLEQAAKDEVENTQGAVKEDTAGAVVPSGPQANGDAAPIAHEL